MMKSILKKQTLIQLFSEEIDSCTLLGIPKKEVKDYYFNNKDLMGLFQKYGIDNPIGEYDSTPISIWFPRFYNKINEELCVVNINKANITERELDNIINSFFTEVIDYYQVNIPPNILLKVLGMSPERLSFSDMLLLTREKQIDIAKKVELSRQTITDIKSGKSNLTTKTLSLLMNRYPLLPWVQFIEGMEYSN